MAAFPKRRSERIRSGSSPRREPEQGHAGGVGVGCRQVGAIAAAAAQQVLEGLQAGVLERVAVLAGCGSCGMQRQGQGEGRPSLCARAQP